MPPNSVLSICWSCASLERRRAPLGPAANLISTSSAVGCRCSDRRRAGRANVLCSVYHGDHRPFRSKAADGCRPCDTSSNASRPRASALEIAVAVLVLDLLQLADDVVGALLEADVAGRRPHQADGREVVAGDVTGEVSAVAVPAAVGLRLRHEAGALAVEREHAIRLERAAGTAASSSCACFSGPPVRRTADSGSGRATSGTALTIRSAGRLRPRASARQAELGDEYDRERQNLQRATHSNS